MASISAPSGSAVFLDSNVLVYHFAPDPHFGPACTSLIDQIEKGVIAGFTATFVIGEMSHNSAG